MEDFNDGDVRSWQEATREIGISALSGAITGALGARFPHMNKLLAGLIDTTLSTVERGFLKAFEEGVTFREWLAYTFDPKTIAFDFVVGVTIDCLVDGITDLFKGRNAAQVVDGITDQVSDTKEDSMIRETREAMEDAVGDSAERTVRESAEEAAERATRNTTGELMDDFDEYEQFYEDLFDRQRETFGEYDDFLDDLKELQRGELDGGNTGNLFEGGAYSKNNRLALGLSDYLDDFASENNAHTWKDFADPVNWKEGVNTALFDPDMKILVN